MQSSAGKNEILLRVPSRFRLRSSRAEQACRDTLQPPPSWMEDTELGSWGNWGKGEQLSSMRDAINIPLSPTPTQWFRGRKTQKDLKVSGQTSCCSAASRRQSSAGHVGHLQLPCRAPCSARPWARGPGAARALAPFWGSPSPAGADGASAGPQRQLCAGQSPTLPQPGYGRSPQTPTADTTPCCAWGHTGASSCRGHCKAVLGTRL